MVSWSDLLINEVCSDVCTSGHTGQERTHLPLGLWRITHDGNSTGDIPPSSRLEQDGCMLPRVSKCHVTPHDVELHLNKCNRVPTPFLSFGTWELVSNRLYKWKKGNVRNLRLHFLAMNRLATTTPVYRVSSLVRKMGRKVTSYMEGEYLIHGEVPASALIFSTSGGGADCLFELPVTRADSLPFPCSGWTVGILPLGFFGGKQPSNLRFNCPRDESGAVIYDAERPNISLVMSDSMTGGKLFTVADLMEHYT
jgi:hypothetical protein